MYFEGQLLVCGDQRGRASLHSPGNIHHTSMPRPLKQEGKVRLNLALSADVADRIEALREKMGADTKTEVIRRALATYEHLFVLVEKGEQLLLADSHGKVRGRLILVPH